MIDDLMFSDADASDIVTKHAETAATQMSAIRQPAAGSAAAFFDWAAVDAVGVL